MRYFQYPSCPATTRNPLSSGFVFNVYWLCSMGRELKLVVLTQLFVTVVKDRGDSEVRRSISFSFKLRK